MLFKFNVTIGVIGFISTILCLLSARPTYSLFHPHLFFCFSFLLSNQLLLWFYFLSLVGLFYAQLLSSWFWVCMCACSVASSRVQCFSDPSRRLCPWNYPGKNTGMGCHFFLRGIFPTQRLKRCLPCLLHWQTDSLPQCHTTSLTYYSLCIQVCPLSWMEEPTIGHLIVYQLFELLLSCILFSSFYETIVNYYLRFKWSVVF